MLMKLLKAKWIVAIGVLIIIFLGNNFVFSKTTSDELQDYYAVIEIVDFHPRLGKTLTIQEEWFKKPDVIRREMLFVGLGLSKKVFIYDGEDTYSYFPSHSDYIAYNEHFVYTPSFLSHKISDKNLELLSMNKPEISGMSEGEFNGKSVYVKSSQNVIERNKKTVDMTMWLDKDNYSILGWEKKYYNSNGEIEKKEFCHHINYDIKLPDSLFKLPKKYKVSKEIAPSKEMSFNKNMQSVLNPENMQEILYQEELLRDLVVRYSDIGGVYEHLANIILFKGKYDEAISLLNKSLEFSSNQENIYSTLSDVYLAKGDLNKSIAAMEEKFKLSSGKSYDYYRLGNLYEKAGITDKARSAYKKALELQPDDIIRDDGQEYRIEGLRKKYLDAYNRINQ